MKEKLIAFALKHARLSTLLPALFKMIAEGKADRTLGLEAFPLQRFYWWTAGKKTITGMVVTGLGAALETLCTLYPEVAWTCPAAKWCYTIGTFLAGVGLIDGGTRSPYPAGTVIAPEAKTP